MYGLINCAIEAMLTERLGAETMGRIKAAAGLEDIDRFLALHQYPDEVTYQLVASGALALGVSSAAVFEMFGEYWIGHVSTRGYGALLKLFGSSLPDFLENLDNLHARLALTFPGMRSPSFRVSDRDDRSLVLHYFSERAALAPFVVGLVRGLGDLLQTPVTVEPRQSRADGIDHDSFLVRSTKGCW